MSTSYQAWLRCLRVGDEVDNLEYYDDGITGWPKYTKRKIKEIKKLSNDNHQFVLHYDGTSISFGPRSHILPCDSLMRYHQDPCKQNYGLLQNPGEPGTIQRSRCR